MCWTELKLSSCSAAMLPHSKIERVAVCKWLTRINRFHENKRGKDFCVKRFTLGPVNTGCRALHKMLDANNGTCRCQLECSQHTSNIEGFALFSGCIENAPFKGKGSKSSTCSVCQLFVDAHFGNGLIFSQIPVAVLPDPNRYSSSLATWPDHLWEGGVPPQHHFPPGGLKSLLQQMRLLIQKFIHVRARIIIYWSSLAHLSNSLPSWSFCFPHHPDTFGPIHTGRTGSNASTWNLLPMGVAILDASNIKRNCRGFAFADEGERPQHSSRAVDALILVFKLRAPPERWLAKATYLSHHAVLVVIIVIMLLV